MKIPEHGVPEGTSPPDPSTPCGAFPCSDRVVCSPAYQLARVELGRLPEIREELVEDLKRRLHGGGFKVDGERVAKKLLQVIDFGWPGGIRPLTRD